MKGKVAALGSSDFVMPFSALGIDTFAADEGSQDVQAGARRILNEKYSLVIVAENIAPDAQQVFETVQKEPTPSVVVVPFTTEPQGFATQKLGEVIKLATGINILKNE